MVNLLGKRDNGLAYVKKSLEDNLKINPASSRLIDVNNAIKEGRYSFKLIGETGTLPINNERPSFLVGDRLFVFGGNALGHGLIILDTKTMEVVKQVKISSTSITNLFTATFDEDYYFTGGSVLHQIIKGNVKTGDFIETKTISGLGAVHGMVADNAYVYVITEAHKIYKLDKSLNVVQVSDFNYINPISIEQDEDFLYIGGNGHVDNNNVFAIIKVQKSNLTITNTSISNSSQIRKILVDGNHIVCGNSIGEIRMFQKSDLTLTSLVYSSPNANAIRNIIKKLDFFWVGTNGGQTIIFSKDWIQKGIIQSGISDNYILEIDEYNKILYRNSSSDVTIAKYQIIDNLQNEKSTTTIKTSNLIPLNTGGTWNLTSTYLYNSLTFTFTNIDDNLSQFTVNGTASADTIFNFPTQTLSSNRSYIINSPKTTDSLSTVYTRVVLSQNANGSGTTQVLDFIGGNCEFSTTNLIYATPQIVVKSGTVLSSVLYNALPVIVSKHDIDKLQEQYLIKDLSEITLTTVTSVFNAYIVDGRIFYISTSANAGRIEVSDYQFGTLLTTINTGAAQSSIAFTYDANYVYIGCIKGTPRSIYIQRYNRRTLAYIDEYLLYQSEVPFLNKIIHKDGFIYAACAAAGVATQTVKKWDTTSKTVVASVFFNNPLYLSLSDSGLVATGRNPTENDEDLYKSAILSYDDLSIITMIPKPVLSQADYRRSVVQNNKIYIANDNGLIIVYNSGTGSIEKEVQLPNTGIVRQLIALDNLIIIGDSFGKLYIYDLDLNLIKTFDFLTATSAPHTYLLDNNKTLWFHSPSRPSKIYKKQFIDMTKDII